MNAWSNAERFDSTGASRKGMLEALPAAIAFGQKAQEDSRLGQSSIFDLGGGAEESGPSRQHHAPIRAEEFDQRELLRLEKETLGTFLSSHPLAEVKEALRARVDCSLSSLADRPDGSWVTVGGHHHRVQAAQVEERLPDVIRDPRRRRGPGRDARHGEGLRGLAASSSRPTRS